MTEELDSLGTTHFNLRLVAEETSLGEWSVSVKEVYYDEMGTPLLATETPVFVDGYSSEGVEDALQDCRGYFEMIEEAFAHPILLMDVDDEEGLATFKEY